MNEQEPVCGICGWRRSLHQGIQCSDGSACEGRFFDHFTVAELPESELAALKATLLALQTEMEQKIKDWRGRGEVLCPIVEASQLPRDGWTTQQFQERLAGTIMLQHADDLEHLIEAHLRQLRER